MPLGSQQLIAPSDEAKADSPYLILDGYIRRDELAKQLGRSPRTIDRWNVLREGPPRVQVGRTIFYSIETVRDWLRSKERLPLSSTTRRTLRKRKKPEQSTPGAANLHLAP